jgi:hypothetical protein
MAVSTVDHTARFFGFLPKTVRPGTTLMGHKLPSNVTHIHAQLSIEQYATSVAWRTNNGNIHNMEFEHPLTPENVTTLLVSMRLSC